MHACARTGTYCTWYRPTSLEQLLALKAAHPDLKLVGGNSEVRAAAWQAALPPCACCACACCCCRGASCEAACLLCRRPPARTPPMRLNPACCRLPQPRVPAAPPSVRLRPFISVRSASVRSASVRSPPSSQVGIELKFKDAGYKHMAAVTHVPELGAVRCVCDSAAYHASVLVIRQCLLLVLTAATRAPALANVCVGCAGVLCAASCCARAVALDGRSRAAAPNLQSSQPPRAYCGA